jgi:hypothetical protein
MSVIGEIEGESGKRHKPEGKGHSTEDTNSVWADWAGKGGGAL